MENKAKEFYENFTPPMGFKVPDSFPIMRGKSVILKKENLSGQMTKAGIVIPDTARTGNQFVGRVYSIGPNVDGLKPGMRVIFNAFANQVIYHEQIEYMFMSDIDIYAILPEGTMTLEHHIEKERRPNLDYDQLPNIEASKEEKELEKENLTYFNEDLKRELTTKHIGVDGTKKD